MGTLGDRVLVVSYLTASLQDSADVCRLCAPYEVEGQGFWVPLLWLTIVRKLVLFSVGTAIEMILLTAFVAERGN